MALSSAKPKRRRRPLSKEEPGYAAADWSVYVLRCADGSLYTGIAKDVSQRVEKHNSGKGAAYTRAHRPVGLLYQEDGLTRSQALIREAAIKRLPRERKQRLVIF